MNATGVISRLQALEATVRTLPQLTWPSTASVSAQAMSSPQVPSLRLFGASIAVYSRSSGIAAVPLTEFNGAGNLPSTAMAVLLSAYGRRYNGVTGVQNIWVQASAASTASKIWSSNSQGSDTDTEGYRAQAWAPCNGSSFWFSIDSGVEEIDIGLIGYYG